jgi:50S ribosomal protein L16 3-hydroxylase
VPELQLDREAFLASNWQQRPLYLPGAVPGFNPPIHADELAGLALESDVESRIVEQRDGEWHLQHGPFSAGDFDRAHPWTLLVQAVDHHVPEVAALRRLVDFLPSWRIDDVMVSYAVDGGSVGPHFDYYDVFLLQGSGRREWRIGPRCDARTPLLPHPELRLLQRFECEDRYVLEPGDILYLPPGVAHWGIARGECTTFSIGFRAPRINDMLSRWVDQLLESVGPDEFYRDLRQDPVTRPGEIRPADAVRALAQVQAALDQASGERWFGELVTEPRYEPELDQVGMAQALACLDGARRVEVLPAAKLAWQHLDSGILVFATGDSGHFDHHVQSDLETLCGEWTLAGATLAGAVADEGRRALLEYLVQAGCIHVE